MTQRMAAETKTEEVLPDVTGSDPAKLPLYLGGRRSTMDSTVAFHPAGPGSNLVSGEQKIDFLMLASLSTAVHCLERGQWNKLNSS